MEIFTRKKDYFTPENKSSKQLIDLNNKKLQEEAKNLLLEKDRILKTDNYQKQQKVSRLNLNSQVKEQNRVNKLL